HRCDAVRHRVNERAAELFRAERVAHGVNDRASGKPVGWDLPELLNADGVELRRTSLVQRESADDSLREVAADPIGEDRDLGMNVDPSLERRLPLTVFADAAIAGSNADDPFVLVQNFDGREAREDIDSCGLDLTAEPLDESIERDDVVAVIPKRRRRDR